MALQVLISGLLLAGVYALIGTGFSLVTGVMRILNFSHGAMIMLGAYVTYWLWALLGIEPFLTVPITMLLLFGFGFLVQRYLINYVVRAPIFMTLILTVGLDMVIVNAALLAWTGNVRGITPSYAGASVSLLGASVPLVRVAAFVVALLLTGALHVLLTRSRMGQAIAATRMDLDAAKLVGVDIARTYALTFGLGAAMAGAAGSLISLISPISPTMGVLFSAKAFAICVLGGFGHQAGALVGGLILGLIESVGAVAVGAAYQQAISFAVLVIILVVRPLGILGKEYY